MQKRFKPLLILLFTFNIAFSQSGSQSPYSRYGLGDIQYTGSVAQIGMGGFSIAHRDSFAINYNNPASYSSIRLTIFDGAARTEYTKYQTNGKKADLNNAGLSYLAIGFPVIYKRWGTSVGLLPYSSTGYNIVTADVKSDTVPYKTTYKGSGGINSLYWGNGFTITKNLSLGFNLSYFFGSINRTRTIDFVKSGYYNSSSNVVTYYNHLNWSLGGLYKSDSLFSIKKKGFSQFTVRDSITVNGDTVKIKTDNFEGLSRMERRRMSAAKWLRFNVGITGSLANQITEHNDVYTHTYKTGTFGVPTLRDTLLYLHNQKATSTLPSFIGVGFSLQEVNHWLIGIDGNFQQWSKYSQAGLVDSLEDSYKISIGGEYVPKFNSPDFWNRVSYRGGLRYGQTQLNLRNTPINEYAVTFGFGFPIRKDAVTAASGAYLTRLNVSFEIGRRGTTKNELLQENYFRMNLGINFTEQWFVKRKYD